VCPLRIGSGIKGKLLTALAMGLPVVATPVAVEGMHMADGVDCLVADSASDVARACARLDEDDELWSRLSAGGLELVARRFSREVVSRQVERVFGRPGPSSAGATRDLAPATLAANE
jgi:O-antigen biosynthesis protein